MKTLPPARELGLIFSLLILLLLFFRLDIATPVPEEPDNEAGETRVSTVGSHGHLESVKLSWTRKNIPETKLVAHVRGWTIFDHLYLHNGTLFVVTTKPAHFPDRLYVISKGHIILNGEENVRARRASDRELQVISPAQAARRFKTHSAARIEGVSWLVNDPSQFIPHYYHWTAELLFGLWRAYSSLDPDISLSGQTTLSAPRRLMFTRIASHIWRDYAHLNQFILRAAFPSITMEFQDDWQFRADTLRLHVFDRVLVADRSAAIPGHPFGRTERTASNAFELPGSVHWWIPIQHNVWRIAGVEYKPGYDTRNTPVITYVSRQDWGRRMLKTEDHERLVDELYKLEALYGYEVNVVYMSTLTRAEQIQLAARTTIMMGVHGNGLTSLVWMPKSTRSTVMEFFFPGGFAYDYEFTSRAVGHVHYGFWGNQVFTSPDTPAHKYVDGFQGNEIPIDGALVARLCHERLSLAEEFDD